MNEFCEDRNCASYIPEGFCLAFANGADAPCSYCGVGLLNAAVQVSPDINKDGSDDGIIILSLIVVGMIVILFAMVTVVIRKCAHDNMKWEYKQISAEKDEDNDIINDDNCKTAILMDQVSKNTNEYQDVV